MEVFQIISYALNALFVLASMLLGPKYLKGKEKVDKAIVLVDYVAEAAADDNLSPEEIARIVELGKDLIA